MKPFLFIILITISCKSFCQVKYILLDKGWNRPAIYTDSVTKENIRAGYFPILIIQADSLLAGLKKFKKIGKLGLKRTHFSPDDFNTSSITYEIANVEHPYGDLYDIDIISEIDSVPYKIKISDASQSAYFTQIYINNFCSYLQTTIKTKQKTASL